MLENLPESATVYIQKNELDPVGATNNLRGLAAKIKFIDGNISQNPADVKYSLSETTPEQRLSGDALFDAQDLIAEIKDVAEINSDGYVTVYHRTTAENAKRILESGKMSAKEDGIFFSTQKDGAYSRDYGEGVVELKVPAEKLVLDDVFDTEAHLRIPLNSRKDVFDVSAYLFADDSDAQNERGLNRKSEVSFSQSKEGQQHKRYGNYNVSGKDVALDKAIAPVAENLTTHTTRNSRDLTTSQEESQRSEEKSTVSKMENVALVAEDIAPLANNNIAPVAETAAKYQKSVGAAPYGFDPVTHLQYEYGTIPESEHPVRDDSLPKSTNGKDKVSLTARTVKGAEATPDRLVDLLDKETVGGRFSYIPIKNSNTVQKADNDIVKKGWGVARGEWEARVRSGEVSAEMTAPGALLLNNAAKARDTGLPEAE